MAVKVLIAVAVVLAFAQSADAQQPQKIAKLKDLCIDTVLVANGEPQAAVVAPAGERYADAVRTIQGAVKRCGGTALPVLRDVTNPEDVLKQHNAIVLGNMATNPFVEHMYWQWYVLLDLKYPGRGGHVVRSLHNPCGTGRNVIWIGGSDDEGVSAAAKVFADLLKPGEPLKVGWLMKIQLGDGMTPPKIGDDVPGWSVYSWRDSWRQVGGQEDGLPALNVLRLEPDQHRRRALSHDGPEGVFRLLQGHGHARPEAHPDPQSNRRRVR